MKEKKKKSHKEKKSKRKSEKKAKKEKKKLEKKLKKQSKALEKSAHDKTVTKARIEPDVKEAAANSSPEDEFCGPSIDLMNRAKCPETREQWEHRQSQIKRVIDSETGRIRLIKGDGEILEEIVTRERHKQINQDATCGDGQTFQLNTVGPSASKYK